MDKQATSVMKRVFATAKVQHHVFLHLSVISGKPTILVLHQPITVVKPLGAGGSDNLLILLGDQHGLSPLATIYFPEEAFGKPGMYKCPSWR
jgi:hypothetical protein